MKKPIYSDTDIIKALFGQEMSIKEKGKFYYLSFNFPFSKFKKVKKATLERRVKKLLKEALFRSIYVSKRYKK